MDCQITCFQPAEHRAAGSTRSQPGNTSRALPGMGTQRPLDAAGNGRQPDCNTGARAAPCSNWQSTFNCTAVALVLTGVQPPYRCHVAESTATPDTYGVHDKAIRANQGRAVGTSHLEPARNPTPRPPCPYRRHNQGATSGADSTSDPPEGPSAPPRLYSTSNTTKSHSSQVQMHCFSSAKQVLAAMAARCTRTSGCLDSQPHKPRRESDPGCLSGNRRRLLPRGARGSTRAPRYTCFAVVLIGI